MRSDQFKALANVSYSAIYDWDLKTHTVWWNDSFFDFFGFSRESSIGNFDYWAERIHPDDSMQVITSLNKVIAERQTAWTAEYRFRNAANVYINVLDRANIIFVDDEPVRVLGAMMDVTSQLKLAELNEDWEERNRLALDAVGLGTWVLDPINRRINWDSRCQQLFGFSGTEHIQYEKLLLHIHSADREMVEAAVQQAISGLANYDVQFRIGLVDQQVRWLRCKGKAYFNDNGEAIRFAGTAQDITEEKRKDEILAGIEKKYQSAFDNASQGIVMLDLSGRFVLVNRAFSNMTGYSQEELYSMNVLDITHEEDLGHSEQTISTLSEGPLSSSDFTKRYIRKDGSILWVSVHATASKDQDGKAESYFSIVQDISKEIAGKIQQQKLLTLVENSVELMSILELNGTNSYINRAGREMLGFDTQEQVLSTPISQLHAPEDLAYVEANVLPTLINEGRFSGEMLVRHLKTGEVFPVHNSSLRIDDPLTGKPLAVGAIMRDLRPELKSREALIESEKRFKNLILNAPVAIGVFKGANLIIDIANSALLQLWSRTTQVIGQPLTEALPELLGQPFPEQMRKVYNTGREFHGSESKALLVRNGVLEECYMNYVYSPIRDSDNVISGVMVVALEVTAQVRAKKELEQSEKRFRDLVMDAPMPIGVYVGKEMRIQLANEEVLRTWGKDASVIGKTFREALPELEGQGFFELLDEVYTSGVPYQATEDKVDLVVDGKLQTFYFNFTYKALKDGNGKIYGIINTATDVTQFVRARQELKNTEERFRIAIESAEMGTWSIHFADGYIYYSERLKLLLGTKVDLQKIPLALKNIYEEDRIRVIGALRETVSGKEDGVYRDEFRIKNQQTGKTHIVRAVGKVFADAFGKPSLAIGTIQDISVQKMTEQELEHQVELRTQELRNLNASLLRSNQELEQFAYVASHDLQEPLRKIRMFSDLITQPENLSNTSVYLKKIRSSAARMSNLIRDLLEFSMINKKEELSQPVDLNIVVQNVLEDFEVAISQKNAQIKVDRLPTIEAIPLQMNQLFYNLLGNALKFSQKDLAPVISISNRLATDQERARLIGRSSSHCCIISVSDNGIGFPVYLQEKIFTIFQRLNGSDFEGTGIGLALCKKITLEHGGDIWAESIEGKGSVFHVLLPIQLHAIN